MKETINSTEAKKVSLGFAALYPYEESNIPSAEEKIIRGKDFISFGDDNQYPEFLYGLYLDCATLQSIINGVSDYITGNRILVNGIEDKEVNSRGETIGDIMGKCAVDYLIYGQFFLQVVRNRVGQIAEIYWIDSRMIRTNENCDVFYYSKDWSKSYGRVQYLTYPKFNPAHTSIPNSIVMVKTAQSRGIYGTPVWSGAIKSALTETKIEEFHVNEISNNFLGSCIINFNNGRPSDSDKEEIERSIEDKFSGESNSGSIMLSFNDTEKNKTTVERLGTDDFDERYKDLASRTREQLFIAFRCSPLLMGLTSETSTGFATDEFNDQFKLFSKTVIAPIQKDFIRAFESVLGKGTITIEPFSLESSDTTIS